MDPDLPVFTYVNIVLEILREFAFNKLPKQNEHRFQEALQQFSLQQRQALWLRTHKPQFAAIPSLPRTSPHKGSELTSGAATERTPVFCRNNSARAHGEGEAISHLQRTERTRHAALPRQVPAEPYRAAGEMLEAAVRPAAARSSAHPEARDALRPARHPSAARHNPAPAAHRGSWTASCCHCRSGWPASWATCWRRGWGRRSPWPCAATARAGRWGSACPASAARAGPPRTRSAPWRCGQPAGQ